MMNFAERQARVTELQGLIAERRTRAHAEHDTLTRPQEAALTQEIMDLNVQLSTVITEDAKPCPHCSEQPHGIPQQVGIKGEVRYMYEVGCLTSTSETHPQTRAIDLLPELAVARWNAGTYEEPSSGPGVKLDSAPSTP